MTTTPRVSTAIHQANLSDAGAQQDPAIVDIGAGRYIVVWTRLPVARSTPRRPAT